MKTVLYYFSATGNSLVVARDLAKELGDADVVPMTKPLSAEEIQRYDAVGIVFPVYMFALPLIVADFFKSVKIKNGAYLFSVGTYGGLPGRALALAGDLLKERGMKLNSGFYVLMPGNYTPLYGAIPPEKQHEEFVKEKAQVKEIASFVLAKKEGVVDKTPFLPNLLLYKLCYKGGSKMIPNSDRDFWFTEACIKCGICEKVCPVNNIKLEQGHPVWLHHCQHCMACLQWCPVEAIQYKKSTLGKEHYHHPEVKAEDIMPQH